MQAGEILDRHVAILIERAQQLLILRGEDERERDRFHRRIILSETLVERIESAEKVGHLYVYTEKAVGVKLSQAIADGVLVEIFKHRWGTLSGGKPIVATAHLFDEVSLAGLLEIWNAYVHWRKHTEPTLPEEERLFATTMNSQQGWVIEDGAAFTLMYPEDY